jgi:hypothetical protein
MLFLLRMDSITALHFLYFCIFPSIALPPLSPLVFRVWEGPDWMCSAMHSPFLMSGGREIHTAEPLVLCFILSAPKDG